MTIGGVTGRRLYAWLAVSTVVLLLVATGLWWALRDSNETTLSAYFPDTVGLYEGSSVRVLGMEVGEITSVDPEGTQVKVDMSVEGGVTVPADAGAVIVAPSLVSDRYVQLTPVYEEGPQLEDGAVIEEERTATPMEIDDLYESLDEVATALGPEGSNSEGALSRLLDNAADNLEGNGENLNTTVTRLSELATTFENSEGDLFETIRNLDSFSEMLAESDAQLDEFYDRLDHVSGFLADDADDVSAALSSLGGTLGEVQEFIEDNADVFTSNMDKLTGITQALVNQRSALAELIDVAPTGMTNYLNSYNAATGSIAIRYNPNELTNPLLTTSCGVVDQVDAEEVPDMLDTFCEDMDPVVDGEADVPSQADLEESMEDEDLPPLPLPSIVAPGAWD